jgi:hypothetical protein
MRHTSRLFLWLLLAVAAAPAHAQDEEVIEDTTLSKVQYDANGNPIGADPATLGKRYCTYKVQGQSPNKLITLGYELQGGYSLRGNLVGATANSFNSQVQFKHGARVAVNIPVISNYKGALNLGLGFQDYQWQFESVGAVDGSFASFPGGGLVLGLPVQAHESLANVGLRTVNLNLTWFKPLNERHFLLLYAEGALNGNWGLGDIGPLSLVRPTYFGLFGWKRNERSALAVGAAYTWRIGEANIIPLVYWYHTFNARWGIEALAPARILVRRTLNPRTLLLAGYELEGSSFSLRQLPVFGSGAQPSVLNRRELELRQSELKVRLQLERELHKFWWVSVQAGWRVNFNHNISASVVSPRGEYLFEQRQTGTWYAAVNVHLVSF